MACRIGQATQSHPSRSTQAIAERIVNAWAAPATGNLDQLVNSKLDVPRRAVAEHAFTLAQGFCDTSLPDSPSRGPW
jgi:hypothetical protein